MPDSEWLGRQAYEPFWLEMQQRARAVASGLANEIIWACEHEAVYTTGRRGVDNRLQEALPAPLIQSDRGGEMTFHGPGQIMLYPVIHLGWRGLGVKQYVHLLEQSCIDLLASLEVHAERRKGFPGVWRPTGKIAALGVRISRGVAFHGMALNVDVSPCWFAAINPCGLGKAAVSLSDTTKPLPLAELAGRWQGHFSELLG
jgi:lipoyl(octanoyl) transferase